MVASSAGRVALAVLTSAHAHLQRSDVNEPTHRESPYTTSFGIGRCLGSASLPSPPRIAFPTRRASVGAGAAFVAATLSSLAGVYFESVVKSTEANAPSLWLRNVQVLLAPQPPSLQNPSSPLDHRSSHLAIVPPCILARSPHLA